MLAGTQLALKQTQRSLKPSPSSPSEAMSSATQQNLVEKNAEFAANFTEEQGKLPIPPARQCAVGKFLPAPLPSPPAADVPSQ